MIAVRSISFQNFGTDRKERVGVLFKAFVALTLTLSLALVPGLAFATQDEVRTSSDCASEATLRASSGTSDDEKINAFLDEYYSDFEAKGFEHTEFNKAWYAQSALFNRASFDPTSTNETGRSLILSGTGNSKAFHEALKLLLVRAGIPENNIKEARAGDHVWTLVQLDGEWTHIDAASNEKKVEEDATLEYLFFGLTDSQIKAVHPDYDAQGNPSATSTKNNYYLNRSDTVIKTEQTDKVEQAIKDKMASGLLEFEIPVVSNDASGLENLIYAQYGNSLNGQEVNGRQVIVSFNPDPNGNGGTYTVKLAKSIADASVSNIQQKPYTGKQAVQTPVVTYKGVTLQEGKDYSISYENATNASPNAVIVFTGLGEFVNSQKRIVFTISKTNIASTSVVGNFQSRMKWTGSEVKQDSITLKDAYRTLTQNDYKISYKNNVNPGVATLIVEGKGNYSGRKEIAFTIEKAAEDQNKPSEITTQGMPTAQRVTGKWVKSGSKWWYSYDAKTKAAQ